MPPTQPSDDKELLRLLKRRDRRAMEALIDAYGSRIHALTRRYTRNEADAEDLTQEIVISLARSLENFRGDSSLSTFVYRAAMNHCLKHVQRRRPENEELEEERLGPLAIASGEGFGDPSREAERAELKREVETALENLSPAHRDVVLLHEMHGLTYAECANALNVPVGTVKSRLFHAFRGLRERLSHYVHGSDANTPSDPATTAATKSSPVLAASGAQRKGDAR